MILLAVVVGAAGGFLLLEGGLLGLALLVFSAISRGTAAVG
jgi:hypothetical protein